jgi:hypothetical protein
MHNIKDERSNNDLIERLCQLSGILFDASSSSSSSSSRGLCHWIQLDWPPSLCVKG